jgi:hypothetical protein
MCQDTSVNKVHFNNPHRVLSFAAVAPTNPSSKIFDSPLLAHRARILVAH